MVGGEFVPPLVISVGGVAYRHEVAVGFCGELAEDGQLGFGEVLHDLAVRALVTVPLVGSMKKLVFSSQRRPRSARAPAPRLAALRAGMLIDTLGSSMVRYSFLP